jgi:oligoendopeptidase F
MNKAQELPPPRVRWDLSALFSGIDDPKIDATWERCLAEARDLEAKYRGRIESPELTAALLAQGLRELEALYQEASKPINYAHLLFACDTNDSKIGAFMQRQMEKMTELNVATMFFELELQATPQERMEVVIEDPVLSGYRHHILLARSLSPYRLTEPEEVILEETANTGARAWVRLFDEVTSNHTYKFRDPGNGQCEDLTQEELLDMLRDPKREVRQAAADCLSQGLLDLRRVLVFIFNNLIQDKKVEDRLRKHLYPEHARHLTNELDKETVDLVIGLCRDNYGLVERFYNLKREILGLDELTHIDRYAPLFETHEQLSYEGAKELVLDAFRKFSPEMASVGAEFFEKSWIDAEPRSGKSGGAFCASNTPDTHPVVFLSYMSNLESVSTLAHELGHGVHASLSRQQTFLNFHGSLPLAELASTFGEMLVFEKLVAGTGIRDKLALYAGKIENMFATVFRQAAMFRFEQRCHERARTEGELNGEAVDEMWQEEMQAMFGSSLKLGEQHARWWSYISHFVEAPFYVYAYSFGELLVLSLFEKARVEGPSFAEKYLRLLRLGGSMSPHDLMATVGVDLRSREFWIGGFAAMEKLVSEFEVLWVGYKTAESRA